MSVCSSSSVIPPRRPKGDEPRLHASTHGLLLGCCFTFKTVGDAEPARKEATVVIFMRRQVRLDHVVQRANLKISEANRGEPLGGMGSSHPPPGAR